MIQRHTLFFTLSLLITWLLPCNHIMAQEDNNRGYIVEIGDMAPDFSVTLDNGEIWTLSENRGKVIMLQFTASWCSVCRKEMPYIEDEIHKAFTGSNFMVIGVDRDESLGKVLKFKEQTGITYPLALDQGAVVFKLFAHERAGVTRNVIIDKDGKIVYLTRLFERDEFNQMKAVIESLLN